MTEETEKRLLSDIRNLMLDISDSIIKHIDQLPIRTQTRIGVKRGSKNTRFMQSQRRAVAEYIVVELHKALSELSIDDCRRVWNRPENRKIWDRRAKYTDGRRGYKNVQSLFGSCLTWFSKPTERNKLLFQ